MNSDEQLKRIMNQEVVTEIIKELTLNPDGLTSYGLMNKAGLKSILLKVNRATYVSTRLINPTLYRMQDVVHSDTNPPLFMLRPEILNPPKKREPLVVMDLSTSVSLYDLFMEKKFENVHMVCHSSYTLNVNIIEAFPNISFSQHPTVNLQYHLFRNCEEGDTVILITLAKEAVTIATILRTQFKATVYHVSTSQELLALPI
jgi:hypothetical protein